MKNSITSCRCGSNHNPLHCIVPPFVLEDMARSEDKKIRDIALENLQMAAHVRAERTLIPSETVEALVATMQGKNREVYDMQNQPNSRFLLPGKLARREGQLPVADVAVNEAYDKAGHTYDFYQQVFGRDSLNGNGLSLISSVHVGKNYNNAFWNGNQMGYGDGDGIVFHRLTKSIDVVGHEFTHGVISFSSKLVYQDEPGAINEHFADVFGSLIKQWVLNQDANSADWLIGNDIVVPAPTRRALRDMKNPGTAFKNDPGFNGSDRQPDHISKKYTGSGDYGGVHINSGILNKAFCNAAINIGGNAWEKAGRIWYDVMTQYLKSTSNFVDLVTATKNHASRLYGTSSKEHKAVIDGWKQVGL